MAISCFILSNKILEWSCRKNVCKWDPEMRYDAKRAANFCKKKENAEKRAKIKENEKIGWKPRCKLSLIMVDCKMGCYNFCEKIKIRCEIMSSENIWNFSMKWKQAFVQISILLYFATKMIQYFPRIYILVYSTLKSFFT